MRLVVVWLLLGGCDYLFRIDPVAPTLPPDAQVIGDAPVPGDAAMHGDGRLLDGGPNDAPWPDCPASYTNRYRVVPEFAPWTTAEATCEADAVQIRKYTHLVVITDASEQTYLASLVPTGFLGWTGYSDLGVPIGWHAITAELPTPPQPWAPNYPVVSGDCPYVDQTFNRMVNTSCVGARQSVCECDDFAPDPTRY